MIGLIWAQAANGVIGRDNAIPWHIPEDMAHFREVTRGSTVVMGRRTWESLPARFRPLPGRRNVVLTRDRTWTGDGAEVAHDLASALAGDCWVIGGAEIYREALPLADVIELTELKEAIDGDSYAPPVPSDWTPEYESPWQTSQKSADLHFRWRRYRRP